MSKRKPLVDFDSWNRAALANTTGDLVKEKAVLHGSEDMPKLRRRSGKRGSGASKTVRVVKGRVKVRVQGITQSIAPAHLIRHIVLQYIGWFNVSHLSAVNALPLSSL